MLPLTIMRDEWENKYIKYITESYWKKTYMNNFHKIIAKNTLYLYKMMVKNKNMEQYTVLVLFIAVFEK